MYHLIDVAMSSGVDRDGSVDHLDQAVQTCNLRLHLDSPFTFPEDGHGLGDWESVSSEELGSEMPHIEDLNKSLITISTEHWKVVQCQDFACVENAPHEHRVYEPQAPKQSREYLRLSLCNRVDCPDASSMKLHSHQGSGRRGSSDGIEVSSSRLQQGEVLPKAEGREAVVVDEFDGRLPYANCVKQVRLWMA